MPEWCRHMGYPSLIAALGAARDALSRIVCLVTGSAPAKRMPAPARCGSPQRHTDATLSLPSFDEGKSAVAFALSLVFLPLVLGGAPLAAGEEGEVHGGAGADVMRGDYRSDVFHGAGGDDSLSGGGGADVLFGGAGDDGLDGGDGNDVLWGEAGRDDLRGGAGEDTLHGGAGDDVLRGGDGNDTLRGGAGKDVLVGGEGDDVYLYELGDGEVELDDTDVGGGFGELRFGGKIRMDGVVARREGEDLRLSLLEREGSVLVKSFYAGELHVLDRVLFQAEEWAEWDLRAFHEMLDVVGD